MSERIFRIAPRENPRDWTNHSRDIMNIEKSRFGNEPGLCEEASYKRWVYTRPGNIDILLEIDDPNDSLRKMIAGECVGVDVDYLKRKDVMGLKTHYPHYGEGNSLYVFSTAILGALEGTGRAKRMKKDLIAHAQKDGYLYTCGHSAEGVATAINTNLGAQTLKVYGPGKWYGSEEPHNFYMLDLSKIKLVKPFEQEEAGCGPSALKMIVDYHGLEIPSDDEIARICRTDLEKGTPPKNLVNGANELGLEAMIVENAAIDDIKSELEQDRPVIVSWFSEDTSHYSVVDELDEKNNALYLKDPEFGGSRRFTPEEFMRVWFSHPADELISKKNLRERWMIVANPRK